MAKSFIGQSKCGFTKTIQKSPNNLLIKMNFWLVKWLQTAQFVDIEVSMHCILACLSG